MSTCVTAARALQVYAAAEGLAGGAWSQAQEDTARHYSEQFTRLNGMCEDVRRLLARLREAGQELAPSPEFVEACIAADYAGPRFEQRLGASGAVAAGAVAFKSSRELRDALRGRMDAGGR